MKDDELRGETPARSPDEDRPQPPKRPAPAGKPSRRKTGDRKKTGGAGGQAAGSGAANRPPGAGGGATGRGKNAKGAGATKKRAPAAPRGGAPRGGAARRSTKAAPSAAMERAAEEQTAVTTPLSVPEEPAVATAATGDEAGPAAAGPAPAPAGDGPPTAGALAAVGRVLTSRRAPRLRTGIAAFLVVAAVLAVLVSTLALWSRSIVFDTDAYVRVVAPVAEDPEARRAVSDYVAARAVQAARLERRIEEALPSDAALLAPALAASLQRFLADEVDAFLGTELARRLWVDINRFTHAQLIAALRDESRAVTIGRNDVTLDLLPLVAVALQKLEDRVPQLLGRDVTLPEIDPATAPDEIRILLQDALGRELPADFGTITVLEGDQGWEAKQALRIFNDLVVLVVLLTGVLVAAALLVSVRRLRTALWLGVGALLAFVLARVIEARLEEAVTGAVTTQGGGAVARPVLQSAVGSLNGFLVWVAVAGTVVAVAAFLAARPSWLEGISDGVARLFGAASDLSTPDTRASRWMAGHLDLLRVGGVAVAVVALLFATASLTAVLLIVLALAVYELALAVYAAGIPRELDERPPQEPPPAG